MPAVEVDAWDFIRQFTQGDSDWDTYAVIEQQTPRPTGWFKDGHWQQSILKSTCLLYGNYWFMRGLLTAAGVSFEECSPQRWQKELHIAPREKGEKPSTWKNRLRGKAAQLYPKIRTTLATADALLLAHYCKMGVGHGVA